MFNQPLDCNDEDIVGPDVGQQLDGDGLVCSGQPADMNLGVGDVHLS